MAPDFLSYFAAAAPLLDTDTSLLCVSAWNDHGQASRALNRTALYRTDVMPGLGWMLNAAVAKELLPGWVDATRYGGWDEYLRAPCVRRGRQCVFPEVARTHTFGAVGNSGGLFYKEHLSNMVLNEAAVDWSSMVSWAREARVRGSWYGGWVWGFVNNARNCVRCACVCLLPSGATMIGVAGAQSSTTNRLRRD